MHVRNRNDVFFRYVLVEDKISIAGQYILALFLCYQTVKDKFSLVFGEYIAAQW